MFFFFCITIINKHIKKILQNFLESSKCRFLLCETWRMGSKAMELGVTVTNPFSCFGSSKSPPFTVRCSVSLSSSSDHRASLGNPLYISLFSTCKTQNKNKKTVNIYIFFVYHNCDDSLSSVIPVI